MSAKQRKSFGCYLLIFLQVFLGLSALFGASLLIVSPDGTLLKFPLEILENSPFNNFLIPGLILFAGLGILPLLTALFLISEKPSKIPLKLSLYQNTHWSWNSSLYIGFILIIWITVEMYMIKEIMLVHVFYIFLGLLIQIISLLPSVKNHYSNRQ